jgi:hypothetical protein
VLLFGALEELHAIDAGTVEATAEELRRDLGDGLTPLPAAAAETDDLARRIEMLELHANRQDKISRRIIELLEAKSSGVPA